MKNVKILLVALALAAVALNTLAQPIITAPLRDQTNAVGTTATFCFEATGTPPLTYQWRSYSNATAFTNIPGETNACLMLTNVRTSRRYGVEVSNLLGAVAAQAILRVGSPAVITQQPTNTTAELGAPVYLTVLATGSIPLSYQWYLNDVPLPGQTNTQIYYNSAQSNHAGVYRVTVQNAYAGTNLFGGPTSYEARLTVIDARFAFNRITDGPVVNDLGYHHGSAWVDYDNDGYPDLFACYGPPSSNQVNHLYHNNRDGTFTRMTAAQVGSIASDLGDWGFSACGDYDNDGWMDAYVNANYSTNILYRNNRDGTFSRAAGAEPRLAEVGLSSGATWGDFDRDGYLDLFVASGYEGGIRSHLYRNTNGGFAKVLGPLSPGPGFVEGCVWSDYDNDGDLDMIISDPVVYGGQGMLVYSNSGSGFILVSAGALTTISGEVIMMAFADYDNDGRQEVCLSRWEAPSVLLRNDGDGQFTQTSLALMSATFTSTWADYDNDGDLDLFVCGYNRSQFLHNNGDGTFTDLKNIPLATATAGQLRGLAAWCDYDNDGFLDIIVNHPFTYTNSFLYHNQTNDNHWIVIKLEGTVANRAALGAKVRVKATIGRRNYWQLREITRSNFSWDDLRAHFGLGDATTVETLCVEWPSGQVTEMHNVASKQFLTLVEPNLKMIADTPPQPCQLNVAGRIGSRYNLWTSSNLLDWVPWCSVTNTNPTMMISDPATAGHPHRFYKSVQP